MRKNNILQENIFATLAKIWAAFQIERKIGDVIDKIPNDPKLRKAFEDIRTADETIKRELNMFCKRNPNHAKCKDKSETK